jgi:ATP-dependent RNA helicase DDX55/SPB4
LDPARRKGAGILWFVIHYHKFLSLNIFLDFLAIRKIPLKEHPYITQQQGEETRSEDPNITSYLNKVRVILKTDRAIHDLVILILITRILANPFYLLLQKSMKAFVSFVQAYSKHEASYIFRVKDLDLVGVAKSFGLLRLPKMPELKSVNREGWEDADVSVNFSAFK